MRNRSNFRLGLLAFVAGWMLACGLPRGGSVVEPSPIVGDVPATSTTIPTDTPFAIDSPTDTLVPSPAPSETPTGVLLLAPLNGSELPASGLLLFDWEPFTGASNYRIDFTNPKGVVVSFNENSTRHERYAESLPWGGDFTWQVYALDSRGRVLSSSTGWRFYKPAASDEHEGEEPKEYEGEERHP